MTINPNKLKLNKRNPRFIKDEKFKQLVQSIKDFPEMLEKRPIVVDTDLTVLGGNMRLRAVREAGLNEVPYMIAEGWTEKQKEEFIIKDNIGFGEWEWDTLFNEWNAEELENWGLELPSDIIGDDVEIQEHEAEEPTDDMNVDVVPGDLIEIGRHRLICGDSIDVKVIERLMNGNLANIAFTDPPFDLTDISYTDGLFMFTNGHLFILNAEQRNVDISSKHRNLLSRWYAVDFRQAHLISNNAPMTRVDYIAEFRNSDKATFYNQKDGFTNLIESCKIHSNKGETIHTQEKKVELPSMFLLHFSKTKDICLDIFLGSGTTMVACEQLDRICYGIELDPKYCQIIINRMMKAFDGIEVRINGKVYNG